MVGTITSGKALFKSTLPQGERRDKWEEYIVEISLNPRSHKGSDSK